MPSTEGIYGQKQPGFSPHPALKRRNKQNVLGRSGSLVLQGQCSTDRDSEFSGRAEQGYPSFRKQAPFLEEVPARLEGCRQRLAAADRAVSKAVRLSAANPQQEAEIEFLQRQLDEVIGGAPKFDMMDGKPSSAVAYTANSEPAPEPPGSAFSVEGATFAPDLVSADEVLEAQAKASSQENWRQLSTIEQQLLELNKKWEAAERERQQGELVRRDLTERLQISETSKQKLQVTIDRADKMQQKGEANEKELGKRGEQLEADIAQLRQDLGVSEGVAQDLRTQVSDLQNRESTLSTQLSTAIERGAAADIKSQELHENLKATQQSNEELTERHKVADAARSEAEARHSDAEAKRTDAETRINAAEAARSEALAAAELLRASEAAKSASSEENSALLEDKHRQFLLLNQEKDAQAREKDALVKATTEKLEEAERNLKEMSDKLAERDTYIATRDAELGETLTDEKKNRAAAEQRISEMAMRESERDEELEAIRVEIVDHKRDKVALMSRLDAANAATEAFSQEAASASLAAANAAADAESARNALSGGKDAEESALQNALKDKAAADEKAKKLETAVQELKAQLEADRTESESQAAVQTTAALANTQNLEKVAKDLKAQLEAARTESASQATEQATAAGANVQNLEKVVQDLKAQLEAARTESASQAVVQATAADANSQKDLKFAEKVALDLKAQLEAARAESASQAATAADLASKVEKATQEAEEAKRALVESRQANEDARLQESSNARRQKQDASEVVPNADAILAPQRSLAADLEEDETPPEAQSYSKSAKADLLLRASGATAAPGFRPTQCQVDSSLQELRLLSLGAVGAPCVIYFSDILAVERADDEQDKTICVKWAPNRRSASGSAAVVAKLEAKTVKLLPSDDESANHLVAALTIFDRPAPGDMLITPDTPRTPASEAGSRVSGSRTSA